MNNIYSLIAYVVIFIIYYVILNYILYLEDIKCKCSNNWKRNFIKFFSLLIIILTPLKILPINTLGDLGNNLIRNLLAFEFVFGIFFIYLVYSYTQNLLKSKCKCSKKSVLNFINNYSKVVIFIYTIILISILSALVQLKVYQRTFMYIYKHPEKYMPGRSLLNLTILNKFSKFKNMFLK